MTSVKLHQWYTDKWGNTLPITDERQFFLWVVMTSYSGPARTYPRQRRMSVQGEHKLTSPGLRLGSGWPPLRRRTKLKKIINTCGSQTEQAVKDNTDPKESGEKHLSETGWNDNTDHKQSGKDITIKKQDEKRQYRPDTAWQRQQRS